MVTVEQVNGSKKGMKDFLELPYWLYEEDKNWCPPLRFERKEFFSDKNPFMKHSEIGFFVAYKNNRPVGRVTAHRDEIYDKFYNTRQGFFGFYESVDCGETAKKLMHASENWITSRGMNSVMGPFNFSTNHEIGFLTKGFDRPPAIMMPYTKSYYPDQLAVLGYKKEKELLAFLIEKTMATPEPFAVMSRRVAVMAKRVARKLRGTYTIKTLNMADLKSELNIILDIYNEAWNKNWGFVPMTAAEIDDMARQLKTIIQPEYIYFLYHNEEPAAFLLALPDINNALMHIKSGKLFPTGIFKLLFFRKYITSGRVLLMGVKKKFRNKGFDLLLYSRLMEEAQKQLRSMEMSWILEDNRAMVNILGNLNADPYKRYLILKKSLDI